VFAPVIARIQVDVKRVMYVVQAVHFDCVLDIGYLQYIVIFLNDEHH
jgi:hypothetical protein